MDYIDKELINLPAFDSVILWLSKTIDVDSNEATFLFCVLSLFLSSMIFNFINGKLKRHIWGIIAGMVI